MMIAELEKMRGSIKSSSTNNTGRLLPSAMSNSYFADSELPQTPPSRNLGLADSSNIPPSPNKSLNGSLFASSSARLRDEQQFRLAAKSSDPSLRSGSGSTSSSSRKREDASQNGSTRTIDSLRRQNPFISTSPSTSQAPIVPIDDTEADIAAYLASRSQRTQPGKEVTPALVTRASAALAQALRDLEREMGILQADSSNPPSSVPSERDDDDTVLAPYIRSPVSLVFDLSACCVSRRHAGIHEAFI